MLEKAYVRFLGGLPNNQNTYAAADGFNQMGVDIVPFRSLEEIDEFDDLGEKAMVCGNIADVLKALDKMGVPHPIEVDYPTHLNWMMGRTVKTMRIEDVRRGTDRVFVKPVTQKLFTGLVWSPDDPRSRMVLAPFDYNTQVMVTEVVDFVSEWRCFVKRHALVGAKHYTGDWTKVPSRHLLDTAIAQGRGIMSDAYTIDLGVTADGQTLLVEVNEGFALGCYGLASVVYASFMEARWEQFVRGR